MSEVEKSGRITSVNGCIVEVQGLGGCAVGEQVILPDLRVGVILHLTRDGASVACLDAAGGLAAGQAVEGAGAPLRIPVGPALNGAVIDPLGRALGTDTTIVSDDYRTLRAIPSVIGSRLATSAQCPPLDTGVLAVDALAPLGRGGRLVVLGDSSFSRSRLASTIATRQRGRGLRVVYVYIGEPPDDFFSDLLAEEAKTFLTLVWGSTSLALSCLAPLAGLVIADAARARGEDVLLIVDSLCRHQQERDRLRALALPDARQAMPDEPFTGWDSEVGALLDGIWARSPAAGGGSISGLFLAGPSPSLGIDGTESLKGWLFDPIVVLRDLRAKKASRAFIDALQTVPGFTWGKLTPTRRRVRGGVLFALSSYEQMSRQIERFPDPWAHKLDAETTRQVRRGELLQQLVAATTWEPLAIAEQLLLCVMIAYGHADSLSPSELPALIPRIVEAARQPGDDILAHVASWNPFGGPRDKLAAWFARVLPSAPPEPAPAAPEARSVLTVTRGIELLVDRPLQPGEAVSVGHDRSCTVVIAGFPEARRKLFSGSAATPLLRLPDGWEVFLTSRRHGVLPLSGADLRTPGQGLRYGDSWLLLPDSFATIDLRQGDLRVTLRYQQAEAKPEPGPGSPPDMQRGTRRPSGGVVMTVLKELFGQLAERLRLARNVRGSTWNVRPLGPSPPAPK